MIPSQNCYNLIKKFEGCILNAYPDPGTGNLPITIGYGSTMYPDGKRIKMGEKITIEMADKLLQWEVNTKSKVIDSLEIKFNQNQFDAIVCFAFNVGISALQKSTLLKLAKANPNNPAIKNEFLKWNKAGGKILNGLTKRRQAEAELYFS